MLCSKNSATGKSRGNLGNISKEAHSSFKTPTTPKSDICSLAWLCMQCLPTLSGPETRIVTFVLPLPHTGADQLKRLLGPETMCPGTVAASGHPVPPTASGLRDWCGHLLGTIAVAQLSRREALSRSISVGWYVGLFVFRTSVKFSHFADGKSRP